MKIALVSEGAYPYAMGGVSVWCDQLIRGLPAHEWEAVALTVNARNVPLWDRPPGLTAVRTIPLWSADPVRHRRDGRTLPSGWVALTELVVRALRGDSDSNAADGRSFASALRTMYGWSVRQARVPDLTTDAAVGALQRSWRRERGGGLSLAEAITWCRQCEHLLRPLFAEPLDVDIVHASMNGPSMLVGMAAKWARGTPVVLSEHGIYLRERYILTEVPDEHPDVRFLRLNFHRLLAVAAYQVSNAIAHHSLYNRRWQLRGGGDPTRMTTMYNGVDTADFPAAESEPEQPTISYLGRLDPIKDIHTLLRAFAIVLESVPNARLRIFGAAPAGQEAYLHSCEELIADLGITASTVLEGPTRDPVSAYHAGSVVALSSISEGFPYTVVEAMACGRPVVCTRVGGVAEAVGDTGLVVPPRDPAAFAEACTFLLLDAVERRRHGTEARARVLEWFTRSRWLQAYDDLYSSVKQAGRAA